MGRVTYLHHYVRSYPLFRVVSLLTSHYSPQLPTLYFSVLMAGTLLDHFIFRSHRLTPRTKTIAFALVATAVVGTWWFFRACAWGIHGPAKDLWGKKWRKVRRVSPLLVGLRLGLRRRTQLSGARLADSRSSSLQSWNIHD